MTPWDEFAIQRVATHLTRVAEAVANGEVEHYSETWGETLWDLMEAQSR